MPQDPVHAALVVARRQRGHGEVLAERPQGARGEDVRVLLRVAGVVQDLARVPVVVHLVVVPLDDRRHLRVEAAQVLVEEVVAERAAELGQRLGDLGLLLGRDVPPHAAVRQRDAGQDRAVGVDVVAAAQEEVGVQGAHVLVHAIAAELRVDAPALARDVARPQEAHPVAAADGGGAERAGDGFARAAGVVGVGEHHAVVDLLARRQVAQAGGAREVRARADQRPVPLGGPAERLRRGGLHDHAGGAVGAGPDQPRVRADVACLDTPCRLGATRQGEGRCGGRAHGGQGQRGRGGERTAQHPAAAGQRTRRTV